MPEPPKTDRRRQIQHWRLDDGSNGYHRADGPAFYSNNPRVPVRQRAAFMRWFVNSHLLRAVWVEPNLKARLAESVLSQRYHMKGPDAETTKN